MNKLKVDLRKIELIRIDLGYNNAGLFARDCGVTYPTYLAIQKSGESGIKFLLGINNLLEKRSKETFPITYFLQNDEVSKKVQKSRS